MICSFFGRSTIIFKDSTITKLNFEIEKVINLGVDTFYNGLCGDFDLLALHCVHKLKIKYPHISSYVIKPYIFERKTELLYKNLYDCTIYPELELIPPRFCISERNKWMAKQCDMAITLVDVDYGGSYKGYTLVKKLGKPVINLGRLDD